MNVMQQQVYEFHRAMVQPVGIYPRIQDAHLRASLMLEETIETAIALMLDLYGSRKEAMEAVRLKIDSIMQHEEHVTKEGDPLIEVADGCADVLYVTFGTAIACGFDLEPIFNEVHRSNMLKAAGTVRSDGKREKPAGWKPPQIARILDQHEPEYLETTLNVEELLRQRNRLLEQVTELQTAATERVFEDRRARGIMND